MKGEKGKKTNHNNEIQICEKSSLINATQENVRIGDEVRVKEAGKC